MQYISVKSLISRTSREFPQVNNKKATQFFWNGQQDLNKHFTEDDVQMANKHTKFSTSLFLRKMQITIITKYTTHSVERIKLKTLMTPRVDKNVGQPESSSFDDRVNQYKRLRKGDDFLIKSSIHYSTIQQSYFCVLTQEKWKHKIHKKTCTSMFIQTLFKLV